MVIFRHFGSQTSASSGVNEGFGPFTRSIFDTILAKNRPKSRDIQDPGILGFKLGALGVWNYT